MPANSLGARIIRARKLLDLSQQQLADLLGVSRRIVSDWENGRAQPHPNNFAALEKILGPLRGGPNDALAFATGVGIVRSSPEFNAAQRQALLAKLGELEPEPHIRNPALIPAPAK